MKTHENRNRIPGEMAAFVPHHVVKYHNVHACILQVKWPTVRMAVKGGSVGDLCNRAVSEKIILPSFPAE